MLTLFAVIIGVHGAFVGFGPSLTTWLRSVVRESAESAQLAIASATLSEGEREQLESRVIDKVPEVEHAGAGYAILISLALLGWITAGVCLAVAAEEGWTAFKVAGYVIAAGSLVVDWSIWYLIAKVYKPVAERSD